MARGGRKGKAPKAPAVSPVTKFLGAGTYQRGTLSLGAAANKTAGTEYEVTDVATNLVASTVDKMFPWVRGEMYLIMTDATPVYYEWAIAKALTTDALCDLDDADAVEKLKRDGKLFGRGCICQSPCAYSRVVPIKFEYRNVKLSAGEELRLWYRARTAMTSVTGWGLMEYSEVVA